jgi:hypothetical protein
VRRRHFRRRRGTKITHRRLVLSRRGRPYSTGHREPAFGWGVTTSKFEGRKFWRGVMRPPAPARSGAARGRVRVWCGLDMSASRSQDQKVHCGCTEEAWLEKYKRQGLLMSQFDSH